VPVFYIEEKIKLDTWDDIVNRPCYEPSLESNLYRNLRVIAVYAFDDPSATCSVSDCHQPHNQGFLVTTSKNKITNICEACGQRFLDTTHKEQTSAILSRDRVRNQKIQLNGILEQGESIKDRVNELKRSSHGANWLYRSLSKFRKIYPVELLTALKILASNKDDNAILSAFEDSTIDQFKMEQVKQLQGLDIFETDIKEALIRKILTPLTKLETIADSQDLNSIPSLTSFCTWADSLEEQFAYCEYLVEEGESFFKPENLERLNSIPLSDKNARITQSLRWVYENATIKK
jgi:uncharacterized Zn finger protein